MKRILIGVAFAVLVALGLLLVFFGSAFRQDEPHLAVLSGIVRLELTGQKLVLVEETTALVKAGGGNEAVIDYARDNGWAFVEQLGAALAFEKNGAKAMATTRQYTRSFQLIDISALNYSK